MFDVSFVRQNPKIAIRPLSFPCLSSNTTSVLATYVSSPPFPFTLPLRHNSPRPALTLRCAPSDSVCLCLSVTILSTPPFAAHFRGLEQCLAPFISTQPHIRTRACTHTHSDRSLRHRRLVCQPPKHRAKLKP